MTPSERSVSLSVSALNREPSANRTISACFPRSRSKRRRAFTGRRIQSFPSPVRRAVLRPRLARRDRRAAVGQPGDHPDHDGKTQLLGEVEGLPGHVVGFLGIRRLEAEDLGEPGVEAAVLLVLRAVHPRIVGADDDQPAVGPGNGRVHERVGGDVEPDVLEGDHGPLPGEGSPQGFLVGGLFVDRPGCGEPRPAAGDPDEVLHDLRGGRSRVGAGRRKAGVDGSQGDGLVAEQDLVCHVRFLFGRNVPPESLGFEAASGSGHGLKD